MHERKFVGHAAATEETDAASSAETTASERAAKVAMVI